MSALGNQAANLMQEHLKKTVDRSTLQYGVVTAVSASGVKFRPLAATDPTEEEYAWIAGQVPVVGDNIAYALMGNTWVVLGVILGEGSGGGGGVTPTLAQTYVQGTAAAIWTINHSLSFYPNVTVTDSAGDQVEGTVTYVSATQIKLTFSAPFAGTAYLS